MNLDQYIRDHDISAAHLAGCVGVTPAFVSQWLTGHRRVPAERCPAIERATEGKVRCEELRPDIDWAVLRENCKEAA